MHWLQADDKGDTGINQLQLDIVGFLAILGEGSVLANAQVSTLSKWIFLPRLIPAPQALMRPTRPLILEPLAGHVSGIFSGNYRDNINHIGNIVWSVPLGRELVDPETNTSPATPTTSPPSLSASSKSNASPTQT